MSEYDLAALLILSALFFGAVVVWILAFISLDKKETAPAKYRPGDLVELQSGDMATITHVGQFSMIAHAVGIEQYPLYYDLNGSSQDMKRFNIVRVMSHVDLLV